MANSLHFLLPGGAQASELGKKPHSIHSQTEGEGPNWASTHPPSGHCKGTPSASGMAQGSEEPTSQAHMQSICGFYCELSDSPQQRTTVLTPSTWVCDLI